MRRVLRILALTCVLLTGMDSLHAQRRRIFTDRKAFGKVTYPSTATVTANMVDGYVKVNSNSRFIFPTSDNSVYRPFAATASGTTGAYFSANPAVGVTSSHKGGNYPPLPTGAPFPPASRDANIGKVSAQEYWDINGATATKITLSWHLESGMSSFAPGGNLSKVYIIGWNGSKWVKIPSTVDPVSLFGGSSYINVGSMTTNAAIVPNTYLAYTFGADLSSAREIATGADSTFVAADEVEAAVYPNPVRDRFFVRSDRKIKRVSVVDVNGRSVLSVSDDYKNGIDIRNIPSGIYLVMVEDDKGKTTSRKIIINK